MPAEPITEAMADVAHLVVLSPHLDDAVLSCGALMTQARTRMPVTAATFFTEAAGPPHTLSARAYLCRAREHDAERLYLKRRAEDRAALRAAGITWFHAGLTEALFRRRERPPGRFPRAGRRIPELSHIYPTYRLHISGGRVSPHDAGTFGRVLEAIHGLAAAPSTLLLAPLAVGGHVDHVLVRTAAEVSRRRVAYYSDFPYNLRHAADPDFIRRNGLVPTTWARDLAAKAALVASYRTQAGALFGGREIPLAPEVYMFPGPREAFGPAPLSPATGPGAAHGR